MSVNAENLTTIFVLSGIFCFCVYPVSSNYTVCKRFTEEPLHRLTAVPLVLSGPFCPAGISPPRGESPLSGEANFCSSCYNFSPTKIPRRGKQAAAAAVTLPFSQLKLGRKVSGDSPRKEFAFHLYYTANASHEVPPCYILTSPTNLRQHRTKSVWRLCTPSACKFPVIFHKNAREYIKYSLRFLFHLTENLTTHLSHNLCAVLP